MTTKICKQIILNSLFVFHKIEKGAIIGLVSLFKCIGLVWFGGFYGISNFVGYLTPNPFLCK